MQKLRLAVFFIFATLSMARAECLDFEIFINEVSKGCENTINHAITFGEPLAFRITPVSGTVRWKTEDDIILATTPNYTPILLEEEDKIFTYIVERNGIAKTIILDFQARRYTVSFDAQGGIVSPSAKIVSHNKAIGALPTPTRDAHEFKGWFSDADAGNEITEDSIYTRINDITLYARWEFTKGTRPTASMLDYAIPTGLIYSGSPIDSLAVSQKAEVIGTFDTITVLYNGQSAPPADAGSYAISAFITKGEDYDSATVSLGNLTISKKSVTLTIISATAKNKTYDTTSTAEIAGISFDETPLFQNDKVSPSDYSINANFASANAGENIEVSLAVSWLPNGPLSKNYILLPASFKTTANIIQATGFLQIKAPEKYELSNPAKLSANKPPFVKDEDIIWEYKRESDASYSTKLPDRVGNWKVRATLPETDNCTGAADSLLFLVERDSVTDIAFKEPGFKPDTALSSKQKKYFVAGANLCNIDSTKIQIAVFEPEMVLSLSDIPQRGEPGEDGFLHYEIPFKFGKPGLDTLIYALLSKDGSYRENDTILIETPIPFESIIGQKWRNVLFINNNPQTNGGYEFESYKWFRNERSVSETQFYSAGPSSADTLNPKDIYKVTMRTTSGMRISTCEGSPKAKAPASAAKPALTKQVLGINGKTAKTGSKIYNLKGSKTENTPAGVYIIEE
ncbi:MAG: InlB B-repeat-containing protein [Candidatus Fibromonas sp.]|jgi:uncharacterized repeat protein (TIGR02543 family)|nr:InlB B-repeat-containing protein [Candidatus Fibromonas sp.]